MTEMHSSPHLNPVGRKSGLVSCLGTLQRGLYDQWCFFIMAELDAHT